MNWETFKSKDGEVIYKRLMSARLQLIVPFGAYFLTMDGGHKPVYFSTVEQSQSWCSEQLVKRQTEEIREIMLKRR